MAATSAIAATPTTRTGEPIAAGERIQTVDILRGFALLGILLVNMAFFKSANLYAGFGSTSSTATGIDQMATWFIQFFAEGKFYTLFSFLFRSRSACGGCAASASVRRNGCGAR